MKKDRAESSSLSKVGGQTRNSAMTLPRINRQQHQAPPIQDEHNLSRRVGRWEGGKEVQRLAMAVFRKDRSVICDARGTAPSLQQALHITHLHRYERRHQTKTLKSQTNDINHTLKDDVNAKVRSHWHAKKTNAVTNRETTINTGPGWTEKGAISKQKQREKDRQRERGWRGGGRDYCVSWSNMPLQNTLTEPD